MTRQSCGRWAKYLVMFTLLAGAGFHSTRLVVGVDAFQRIFTPVVDSLFSIPLVLGVAAMVWGWSAFRFRGRLEWAVAVFTLIYFAASLPLHLKTWMTQDTGYIAWFPWWYSIVFLSYTSGLLWIWARLRISPDGPASTGHHRVE